MTEISLSRSLKIENVPTGQGQADPRKNTFCTNEPSARFKSAPLPGFVIDQPGKSEYRFPLQSDTDGERFTRLGAKRVGRPSNWGSGRFLSEDPSKDRSNWFTYAGNNPIGYADENGKELTVAIAGALIGLVSALIVGLLQHKDAQSILMDCLSNAAGGFAGGLIGNAAAAGAVSALISSILGDILNGRAPRWGRAFAAAGVGGIAGAVFGAVANIDGKNASMKAMLDDLDDDCGQFDAALGVLGGTTASSGFDTYWP